MSIESDIESLSQSIKSTSFQSLVKLCDTYFGSSSVKGSHHVYKTPWQGDPRINLQKGKDKHAKPYQVRQVISALRKLQEITESKHSLEGEEIRDEPHTTPDPT